MLKIKLLEVIKYDFPQRVKVKNELDDQKIMYIAEGFQLIEQKKGYCLLERDARVIVLIDDGRSIRPVSIKYQLLERYGVLNYDTYMSFKDEVKEGKFDFYLDSDDYLEIVA